MSLTSSARAAGTGAGHELPSELPLCARREGARLLMAHMDPLDLALMDRVGDAVKRVADDPVGAAVMWRRKFRLDAI
jgi:hypothetical protein